MISCRSNDSGAVVTIVRFNFWCSALTHIYLRSHCYTYAHVCAYIYRVKIGVYHACFFLGGGGGGGRGYNEKVCMILLFTNHEFGTLKAYQ